MSLLPVVQQPSHDIYLAQVFYFEIKIFVSHFYLHQSIPPNRKKS